MKRIKDLPSFKRPREKLQEKGAAALTDTELVAVILGSGTKGIDVMTLSARVTKLLTRKRGRVSLNELAELAGIGLAKASQITAGFELAGRYAARAAIKITSASDIIPLLSDIAGKQQEYFICISLNGANEVIEKRVVTVGLLDKSQVHPREVFADVISDRAAAVILAHNHPSGELKPSNSDLKINDQLMKAAEILGIRLLDHVIVAKNGYYSFQEHGLIH